MYFDSLLKSKWWKLIKKENYIKVETSYKKICIRWIRFLIYFFARIVMVNIQNSLRKNHSDICLFVWHRTVKEKLRRTYLFTQQSPFLTVHFYSQQMKSTWKQHHYNNINTILYATLLCMCMKKWQKQTVNISKIHKKRNTNS